MIPQFGVHSAVPVAAAAAAAAVAVAVDVAVAVAFDFDFDFVAAERSDGEGGSLTCRFVLPQKR